MFAPEDLSCDDFIGGALRIYQPRFGYRAAMDPVLLAAACGAQAGESVLELGCGAGVASLCLGRRVAGLDLHGLELQPVYADLARRNAQANDLEFTVHEGDLEQMPAALRQMSFDHVIANPPYFAPQNGTAARDAGRETAQREATPLSEWIRQGLKRLKPSGHLVLIQNADRLDDILCALHGRSGAIRILPIAARQGRDAGRVIVISRKGAKTPLKLLAPLVLHARAHHTGDAEDLSEVAQSILRMGQKLPI
ncbi:methyltransferase [Thioclava sp. GXIMD2076]|uniref:Methyltransferase n=1 Tax=Thioclava kandeliae TaxID=3070818 RepID=A0ABV1SGK2_9RHOB